VSYLIGRNIKRMRKKLNVSETTVAEYLGIDIRKYILIEAGQADISFFTIKKIADLFGVEPRELSSCHGPTGGERPVRFT